jgi:HD-GYP domain-containing protein (c-di-GMP phosphodiesterase class II)
VKYLLNIREVTYALSEALDFVGIDDTLHGKRVAYMASLLAHEVGFSKEEIDEIIFAGMIHDCGVSSSDEHTYLLNELDWENSQIHAKDGAKLLKKTQIYKNLAPYVKYHHTYWKKLPSKLSYKEKLFSNIIYLVDRVDALRAQKKTFTKKTIKKIEKKIKKQSTKMFSSELVEAFLRLSSRDVFWFYLDDEPLEEYLGNWILLGKQEAYSFEEIREVALMFANIVDAKSTYTAEHSRGVSNLAKYLSSFFELSKKSREKIELAALLHDLGKLRIDDAILNKPSKLNADEKRLMDRHSFDTGIILNKITGFKDIAHIASLHHEKLNGMGYPYNLTKEQIPFESRIISVADIFQALIQDRPYRKGLGLDHAFSIVEQMSIDKELDFSIVEILKENLDECFKYAYMEKESA